MTAGKEGQPQAAGLKDLDTGTKILGFIGVMVWTFLFNHPGYAAGLLVLLLILLFMLKIERKRWTRMMTPLLPFMVLIGVFSAFFPVRGNIHDPEKLQIIFYLLPGEQLGFSWGGAYLGLTYILRLMVMLTATLIMNELISLEGLLSWLRKVKVPDSLAFAFIVAIRFVPALNQKRLQIVEAQKARGARFMKGRLTGGLKSTILVMVPLMVQGIFMAEKLSMAMLNRGYGYGRFALLHEEREGLEPGRERLVRVMILCAIAVAVYIKLGTDWGAL